MASAASDFIGFLDGLQARNLAAIERDVELPLVEMQTRVSMILRHLRADPSAPADLTSTLRNADAVLNGHDASVVDRLIKVGETMATLLIEHSSYVRSSEPISNQFKGFVRAFLDAAVNSHSERIAGPADHLVKAFQEVTAR